MLHSLCTAAIGCTVTASPSSGRLGGDATLNAWPENAGWDFAALGKGHDQAFWTRFLGALAKVDPDLAVNIEHEDAELGPFEGLEAAAKVLTAAAADV